MIRSFRDRRTERFADGERVAQFEPFRRQAEKRLRLLEAATSLTDLAQLPGNRLEALRGDRKDQFICFTWPPGADGPENVEITDYR
jgi:toxin HigB-1